MGLYSFRIRTAIFEPPLYHWRRESGARITRDSITLSNFRVGFYAEMESGFYIVVLGWLAFLVQSLCNISL
jgi:hypothetical protein